jgi:hypothetical protein
MLPLGQSFSLFGKAGAILKTVDASEYNDLKTLRREVKSTKTSALLGAGVEFKVTPQLALRAEYEYLGKTPLTTNDNGPQLRNDLEEEELPLIEDPVKTHKLAVEIESAIPHIYRYWLPHRKSAVETVRHETPKPGRNDVCSCGSGKKYKKCCGAGQAEE